VELPESLVVIPVPLFAAKQRSRGFNQAGEIAKALVALRKRKDFRLEPDCLIRSRDTSSQIGLTRHQRRANLRGAFAVRHPERLRDQTILLVDDVMTTGTTAAECARLLLRAGAREVMVATVARAIRETPFTLADLAVEAAGKFAELADA
jgi:ComF family protein